MNSVTAGVIFDVIQALFKVIPWRKIYDQYLYRVIVKSLRGLANRTTNKVDDEVVEAIIELLEASEVVELDDYA